MVLSRTRKLVLPALAALTLALPAAAEDSHHPDGDAARRGAAPPAAPGPGGMMGGGMMGGGMMAGGMMGGMMQMMQHMMAMMGDRGGMHRMGMMGMGGMGMMRPMQGGMAGGAVQHVDGHIAFLKAELKITAAQDKAWTAYAAALRANAGQLNALREEMAKAPAAAAVERMARREKTLAAQLEIVRRTKPALTALYAALTADQKRTFDRFAAGPRMGMR